jgi:tetratricopeptide (TPR) repeat protein
VTQRLALVVAALVVLVAAPPVFAQARATGSVRDTDGRGIKGATVRAVNREASPPEITSTTDDRGRWAMIGLRSGSWTFIVEAPGYAPVEATATMRVAGTPPMTFTLARDPGPIPGALDKAILQQVSAANALRDRGQFEQALAAYEQIRELNPKLTSITMMVAGVYRQQAAAQTDSAARRTLLERAIATYGELVNDESTGERAKAEIENTRAEVQAVPREP